MIKGKKQIELTYDSLLERTTEYDIYRYYIGHEFEIGSVMKAPYRKDDSPSFFIGSRGQFLHHTDLGRPMIKGNCVQYVMQTCNLNYNDALRAIDRDLGLGISSGETYIKKAYIDQIPKIIEPRETLIQVRVKKFDLTELAYWNQFHLDLADLKAENVFSVKELTINKVKQPIKSTELVFGYLYDDKWKIYWPLNAKESRWRTNVPLERMDGISELAGCNTALIVKSKKDKMVAKKFVTPCVAATQNESTGAISKQNIEFLQKNVNQTYIIFDSDKAGVENSIYYNQFGFEYWNVPQKYAPEGIKDLAELVHKHGPDRLVEEITKKIKL
jgi:hypothetical protein